MKFIVILFLLINVTAFAQNDCKFDYELESSGDSTASGCLISIKTYSCPINYTKAAESNNIEGIVLLSANFNQNCELVNFETKKSLGYGLDEIAINLLKEFAKQLKIEHKTCCFHEMPIMFPVKFNMK